MCKKKSKPFQKILKIFLRQKTITKEINQMSSKEILLGIYAIKKRSSINNRQAIFLNATISKYSIQKLRRKKIYVEILNNNGIPSIKVSW